MKTSARLILAASLALAACDKRKTTVIETQSEGEFTAVAPAKGAPEQPAENPLLATLSPADRAAYEGWFKKYNLAPDPATMDADPDGDGYPNREEFLAGTNPRDPLSMPGLLEGVSVKSVEEVKIPMLLREVKGSTARIERTDTQTIEELSPGGVPKGLPYKVKAAKYAEKADKHGVLTDVSNVTLENTDTKETVILVRDLPARSSETHAVVVGSNGTEKKIHLDETVELPGIPGKQFKVLELRGDQILVEDLATKQSMTIPKR